MTEEQMLIIFITVYIGFWFPAFEIAKCACIHKDDAAAAAFVWPVVLIFQLALCLVILPVIFVNYLTEMYEKITKDIGKQK